MSEILPSEIIENKIYLLRGKKVMLDRDLARLYGVETKQLTRAVRRNIDRFPLDFMFQLTIEESDFLRRQFGTSSWGGARYLPLVFTEQGIAMLSSVLKSKQAIQVNIQIMRTFTKLREMVLGNKELRDKVEQLEHKYDGQFKAVFDAIKMLIDKTAKINAKIATAENKPKRQYGFLADKK
jgi:hypothetical protein